MGVNYRFGKVAFRIDADKKKQAFNALKDSNKFAEEDFEDLKTLEESFKEILYLTTKIDGDYNIIGLSIYGDNKITYLEREFFEIIAPFVDNGSFIEYQYYEYGEHERYVFRDGQLKIKSGKVIYADA